MARISDFTVVTDKRPDAVIVYDVFRHVTTHQRNVISREKYMFNVRQRLNSSDITLHRLTVSGH